MKMLSVNAPTCTLDFSTQKPSHLSLFMVTTSPDNFPDHMKYFSRPAMKPTRAVLLTPPRPSKDSEQARRRQIFLTKVKQAGDNQKWQSRSDQVRRKTDAHPFSHRLNRYCEQTTRHGGNAGKQMQLDLRRIFPPFLKMRRWSFGLDRLTVARKVRNPSHCRTQRPLNIKAEMETVEAIQHQEDQKFDALVSTLQESDPAPENNEMTDYGSDDEDFDWICMEVIAAAEAKDMEKSLEALNALSGDMDMSVG